MQATVLQHIKHHVKASNTANNAKRAQMHNNTAKSAYTFEKFRTAISHMAQKEDVQTTFCNVVAWITNSGAYQILS